MPRDAARLCSSGKSIAESPVPPRRRLVAVAVVEPSSATSETPDVTSVVSLNGFLPSKKPRPPGSAAWWPGALGSRFDQRSGSFAARQLDGGPVHLTLM